MSWLSDRTVRRLQDVVTWPMFTDPRYVAVREIGRGGMGVVYLATDGALGREVAIKVSNATSEGAEVETRLAAEAMALARLEHPGIVPIHDAGQLADGRRFYVMKRVDGELLGDHLERVPERLDRLRLFERLCEPVAFAHARGFVHRDLKPDNVMVGSFGEVLVMDWGVAKGPVGNGDRPRPEVAGAAVPSRLPDDAVTTASGTVLGTPGYMAPEQASGGSGDVDPRADVYALGAILFMLVTHAAPPVWPDEARAVLERRRDLPRPLRAIIGRAMAGLPQERYPGALELAADLGRFRDGLPVRAYRENPFERAWRVLRRYRAAVLLVLAYLVMRAVVQLWLSQRPGP